ncbi:MAG: PD-(D/E)XK nuclease family protein [Alphaproteobacteria bacterium]|nr:PD-(D/E)XK nuclease family protein [Alphaproteobacteria bacterium]
MIQTVGLSDDLSIQLVDLVLKKTQANPFEMAKIQIILPTRRACLAVKQAFLQKSRHQSLLLPNLIPLYELDDLSTDIPPALSGLERILILSRLCAQKPNVITTDQSLKMAISLAELLDEFYQFETDTTRLADLVQNPVFAEHWNDTVIFLDIITKEWPKILKEKGMIDEVDRRIRLIDSYTHHLNETNCPVIAAGLDAGLPVVQRLLATIDKRKNGLILTDGADIESDTKISDKVSPTYYQSGIYQILKAIHKTPSDIQLIGSTFPRDQLIRCAFKPEEKSDEWRSAKIPTEALTNVTRIDCETPVDEALTIALILRSALEKPGQTAALVTPDRALARRVIAEMKRWNITLDDSAGTPVMQTEIGIFLRQTALVGINHGAESDMLALCKHPLAADGQNPMSFRQKIKALEKEARQTGSAFKPNLQTDFDSFICLFNNTVLTPFSLLLTEHIKLAEKMATSHDRSGPERLWQSDAGKALFEFLTLLADKVDMLPDIEPATYLTVLEILFNTITVRRTYGMHPRLDILGPIEARFHHADICIIAGLNEGTFPELPDTGPWLNRPMRQALNLPAPESKIASLSMDFAHCFCSPKVFLTRSKKSDGAETIPSRFLSRLEAALAGSGQSFPIQTADWAKALDTPSSPNPAKRPAPCPPISARPDKLSVTKIELWMRNPYAIYARYILKLFPLNPLGGPTKQQAYGSAVHKTLELFIREELNNKSDLMDLADRLMTEAGLTETDKLFCLPRFEQTAGFILAQQQETSGQIKKSFLEQTGSWTLDVNGHSFTLTGTADRIDIFKNGSVRILDYKTGTIPSIKEVKTGYAPQLPLEALLLAQGGFPGISPAQEIELAYWKLAAKEKDCKAVQITKHEKTDDIIRNCLNGLKNLIWTFYQPDTPYEVCPIAGKEPTYNDYEHLSRRAEWGHGGNND